MIQNQNQAPAPAPSAADVSAAMAALGAYAQPPTAAELEQQAAAVGGEHVLAAVLANALYGASVGAGMLAEGHMLARGAGAREMALARQQVIKASGADGPGVIGALHWQAGQVSHVLKGLDEQGCGPVIAAAARSASALLSLLACSAVFSTEDVRAGQIPEELARARTELAQALAELDELPATAAAMFPGGLADL
uniref:Putative citrate lyase beta chain n=1 Tax=Streptomyces tenjimariensis TaxID=29308 RepID=Q2UZA2_9ACTN|nr:putative citrate lyase beta chain [Streptomyces tenjimariensis]